MPKYADALFHVITDLKTMDPKLWYVLIMLHVIRFSL